MTVHWTLDRAEHFTPWREREHRFIKRCRERREREESRFGRFLPIVDYANVSVSPDDTSMGSAGPTDRISKQTTVNIHATPEYGFRFVRWNDGNTDNPRPVFLTQDTAFTAYFEPKTRHQVSTECRAQGTGIVTGGG